MTRPPVTDVSGFISETRYRDSDVRPAETSIEVTWRRLTRAVAAVEREPALWTERFLEVLDRYRFLPAGRILAGP